jgi:hypothetical protein
MKPYIESSYQTIGLNGRMFSSVAGHLIRRPLRPVTSIAVSIYYRELASLRYLSPLHLERQDLSEPVALQKEAFIIPEKSGLKRRGHNGLIVATYPWGEVLHSDFKRTSGSMVETRDEEL